jgi:GNAT superfamily N-acetyltransferase
MSGVITHTVDTVFSRYNVYLNQCFGAAPVYANIINRKAALNAMFTPCPPEKAWRTEALFKGLRHNLAVASILSGGTASPIWVDDIDSPVAGVTRSGSRVYVAGEVSGDLFSSLAETLTWGAGTRDSGVSVIYLEPGHDDDRFLELEGFRVTPRKRNYYEVEATRHDWKTGPPKGYTIHMVDRNLLSMGLKNTDRVIDEMRSERPTLEGFLENCFSFCAVASGEIAGWCMSEYNTGDRFEIGIETTEKHRRRGLALQTAKATINYGIARGYRLVGWHCWADNMASNGLAQALGFSHVCEYPAYVLRRAASTT